MKYHVLLIIGCLLTLGACSSSGNEGTDEDKKDSTEVAIPEIEYHPVIIIPSVHEFLFTSLIPNSLSGEYEEVPVDLEDHTAFLPTAQEVYIGKYKRRKTTTTTYGSGIKPEVTLQTFSYDSPDQVEPGLLQWLKSFEGGENLEALGQPVSSLKTPPFIVLVEGVDVTVMSTKCEHTGKEWEGIRSDFLAGRSALSGSVASWAFEVQCGGPLKWLETALPVE